jgi:hypothetical protein
MNIHEYQAKDILSRFGVAVAEGIVVDNAKKLNKLPLIYRKRQIRFTGSLSRKFMPVAEARVGE